MPAEKRASPQASLCLIRDRLLGASRIGNQRVFLDQRIKLPQRLENAGDGLRKEQQIGSAGRLFECRAPVDGAALNRLVHAPRGTDPQYGTLESGLAQSQPERAADQ